MLTFIVSHERSGSHLLAEAIASFSGVRVFDEVCNPHAVPPRERPESLHAFRRDWIQSKPDVLLHPSFAGQRDLNEAFFRHLLTIASPHHAIADIKFAHIHNFEEVWWPILRRPTFFFSCQRFKARIILLHRLNTLEAAVSAQIAEARKLWHSWQDTTDNFSDARIEIRIDAAISEALLLGEQTRWIANHWLPGVDHMVVTYEELTKAISNGDIEFLQKLATHVGGEYASTFKPQLQKLGKPLRNSVANYADLVSACRGTSLEAML